MANVAVSRKLLPDLRFGRDKWSPGAIWEIVSTGIWTSINNLGNVLNNGLDLWITNRMLDAVVLGQISVVKTIAFLSNSVIMKVSSSFKPRLLMLYAEKRMSQLTELLKKAMRCTGFFEAMVIGLFSVSGYDFFRIWLPGQNTKFIFWGAMIVLASDLVPGTVNPAVLCIHIDQAPESSKHCNYSYGSGKCDLHDPFIKVDVGRRVCRSFDHTGDQRSAFF